MSRPLALVTGASSGIGLEFARVCTENDLDVVITADDAAIHAVTTSLRGAGAEVIAVQADLATDDGVASLIAAVEQTGRQVDVLMLNAGIGNGGRFVDIPLADEQRLLALNIGATVHLAKHFVPLMVQRRSGRILVTSSIAGTMPGPYYATYAPSKAFLLSFAEALRYEVKDDDGVTVTALMPGPTDTDFFDRAGMQDTPIYGMDKDDPRAVAQDGFAALMSGKDHVVAGSTKNRIQAGGGKFMTEQLKAGVHARMTEPKNSGD